MDGLILLVFMLLGVTNVTVFHVECIKRRNWSALAAGWAMLVAGVLFWYGIGWLVDP